jgi:hypothetical protein
MGKFKEKAIEIQNENPCAEISLEDYKKARLEEERIHKVHKAIQQGLKQGKDFNQVLSEWDNAKGIWTTKEGEEIPYTKMTNEHIDAVLKLFEEGKFKLRICQYSSIVQEKLRRTSKAGEVLYGKK